MDYLIETHEVPAERIISIRDRRPMAGIPTFMGACFDELFGRLRLLGADPAGPPFVIYHEFGPSDVDAEVCVPVPAGLTANGTIHARDLPPRTVARTLHLGPYEELGGAYDAVTDWIEDHGYVSAGPVHERYLNGPGEGVTPAEYRTEIDVPIVRQPVAVG